MAFHVPPKSGKNEQDGFNLASKHFSKKLDEQRTRYDKELMTLQNRNGTATLWFLGIVVIFSFISVFLNVSINQGKRSLQEKKNQILTTNFNLMKFEKTYSDNLELRVTYHQVIEGKRYSVEEVLADVTLARLELFPTIGSNPVLFYTQGKSLTLKHITTSQVEIL